MNKFGMKKKKKKKRNGIGVIIIMKIKIIMNFEDNIKELVNLKILMVKYY